MNLQSLWSKITNDAHIPIALVVFATTSFMHFRTHVDLGANYTNSVYALYGFLSAHGAAQQVWPDKGKDGGSDDKS